MKNFIFDRFSRFNEPYTECILLFHLEIIFLKGHSISFQTTPHSTISSEKWIFGDTFYVAVQLTSLIICVKILYIHDDTIPRNRVNKWQLSTSIFILFIRMTTSFKCYYVEREKKVCSEYVFIKCSIKLLNSILVWNDPLNVRALNTLKYIKGK